MGASQRGSVFVEYIVVLSVVSLGCAAATVSVGSLLLRLYRVQQAVLLLPVPP